MAIEQKFDHVHIREPEDSDEGYIAEVVASGIQQDEHDMQRLGRTQQLKVSISQ